ncbi:MAG: TetR/AcrR family transcriptional regulator [Epsilonproteobacteria bacterium]|nr:TetR/AcrR family transcriptional regulator [Campylobacterota bacterium]
MKATWRRKMAETKRQMVLEAVAPLFEKEGFSAVRMQDVAAGLGISVGALYKLYPSKEALFHAYVGHQISAFAEELALRCEGVAEPTAALAVFVALKFEVFRQKRKAIEDPAAGDPLFFLKLNTRQNEAARPVYEFLADRFRAVAAEMPLVESDMLKMAYLFNAYTTGYVEHWLQNADEKLDERPENVVRAFLNGHRRV